MCAFCFPECYNSFVLFFSVFHCYTFIFVFLGKENTHSEMILHQIIWFVFVMNSLTYHEKFDSIQ